MNFARYNGIVALLVIPLLATIILMALFHEAVTGDLTTFDGYFDDDFGWNEPQIAYVHSGFKKAKSLDDYDGYYDVVVFGDSFSVNERSGWQNVLHEKTGFSIISFASAGGVWRSGLQVESIINSRQFREHPPRYFIFETVERLSLGHLLGYADSKYAVREPFGAASSTGPVELHPRTLETYQFNRIRTADLESRMQFVARYLIKTTNELWGDLRKTRVMTLTRSDLFSSGHPDWLLVLDEDTFKIPVPADMEERAARGLRVLEQLVQSNGTTRFMFMIFPDKLTAYAPYLKQKELATPNYIAVLARHYSFPRIDIAFHNALAADAMDLYLPNDSHTGYLGHRLAAETLSDFYLTGNGGVNR